MSGLILGLSGGLATVAVALLAWFGGRRLQAATAEKTTGEGWDLLTRGLSTRLTALESENEKLRGRLDGAERRIRLLERTLDDHDIEVPVVSAAVDLGKTTGGTPA